MQYSTKKLFFSLIFLILYVIFTNSYFSYEESLILGGADGFSYMNISKEAPSVISKDIMLIHAERFFFPYVIGLISKFLNIDTFYTYRIFVFVVLFFLNFYIYKIFKHLKYNNDLILSSFFLINLNPYISRFYISIPTIINDLIFILGFTIIIYCILKKNRNIFEISFAHYLSFWSRQSSVALLIAYILSKISSKKNLLNKKEVIIGLLIFFLYLVITKFYTDSLPNQLDDDRSNYYSISMRVFGIFNQQSNIYETIKFLTLPVLSYIGLIIFCILFIEIKKQKLITVFKSNLLIFLIVTILLLILQPILSGPIITGRNIIRLTTLAFIPMLLFILIMSNKKKIFSFERKIVFYIVLFAQSFHPTFSKIKVFELLKF